METLSSFGGDRREKRECECRKGSRNWACDYGKRGRFYTSSDLLSPPLLLKSCHVMPVQEPCHDLFLGLTHCRRPWKDVVRKLRAYKGRGRARSHRRITSAAHRCRSTHTLSLFSLPRTMHIRLLHHAHQSNSSIAHAEPPSFQSGAPPQLQQHSKVVASRHTATCSYTSSLTSRLTLFTRGRNLAELSRHPRQRVKRGIGRALNVRG